MTSVSANKTLARFEDYSELLMTHTCVLTHFSRVRLCAILWTVAYQAPLPVGVSRQESWSGLLCPPL